MAVQIDQGQKGDGHIEQTREEAGDPVATLLVRGVEDLQRAQCREALRFIL